MTEDEALTKWCPHARIANRDLDAEPAPPAYNRLSFGEGAFDASDYATTLCVGSHCMAWRWTGYAEISGYCGLAGPVA